MCNDDCRVCRLRVCDACWDHQHQVGHADAEHLNETTRDARIEGLRVKERAHR
jgi:hypothetical protein